MEELASQLCHVLTTAGLPAVVSASDAGWADVSTVGVTITLWRHRQRVVRMLDKTFREGRVTGYNLAAMGAYIVTCLPDLIAQRDAVTSMQDASKHAAELHALVGDSEHLSVAWYNGRYHVTYATVDFVDAQVLCDRLREFSYEPKPVSRTLDGDSDHGADRTD